MTQEEVKNMWQSYFESKLAGKADLQIQKDLVEYYYNLVRLVAQRMHQKHPQLSADELMSMGVDGLYQAIDGFDSSRNIKFETYAMYRIRGSMLDEIRKADWVPRLVRANSNWLDRQRSIHESAAGRKLRNDELYECIGSREREIRGIEDEADFENYVESASTTAMHNLGDIQNDSDDTSVSIDHINDSKAIEPIERMLRQELFSKLMGKNFTPQERKIIWLYYFQDFSMKEISDTVKLSESSVSKIHCDVQQRLKQKAERNPEYFDDIWSMISEFKEAQHS